MTSNFGYIIAWINVTPHFMIQLLLSVEQLWSCSFIAPVLLCKIWFYHVWELSKFILCNFEKFRCSFTQWPKEYKSRKFNNAYYLFYFDSNRKIGIWTNKKTFFCLSAKIEYEIFLKKIIHICGFHGETTKVNEQSKNLHIVSRQWGKIR